jgi:GT2 family glycosyltransferase
MSLDRLASVDVVIVTFNSAHVLELCLESIPASVSVTVVDNGSTDSTLALLSRLEATGRISSIRSPRNDGFARAVNKALSTCSKPFALVLNPDCVLEPGSIEQLVGAADAYEDAAVVAPLQIGFDRKVRTLSFLNDPWKWSGVFIEPAGDVCVDVVPGTALLLVMNKLRSAVGFFDEQFFLYCEDTDLCLRVKRAGLSCIVNPRARVLHDPGLSCNLADKSFQAIEFRVSQYLFQRKYRIHALVTPRSVAKAAYCLIRIALRSNTNFYRSELTAIVAFWKRVLTNRRGGPNSAGHNKRRS